MARQSIRVSVRQTFKNGDGVSTSGGMSGAGADAATMVTDQALVAAPLATLVADGASPTQAHVTAVNNAYTTLAADIAALNTALAGDVVITWDSAKVTSMNHLKAAFAEALRAAAGGGILTA